jgi:hypothetical protein
MTAAETRNAARKPPAAITPPSPEIEGGGVPAVCPSEKQGRRYVADVRHHGRGEAGKPDPGEEIDRADLQGGPDQEQEERGEPGDRHAGENETPAAQPVGDQAQRQGEERRSDHETGVDHPDLYRGRPEVAGEQGDQGKPHVGAQIQNERKGAGDEDGGRGCETAPGSDRFFLFEQEA